MSVHGFSEKESEDRRLEELHQLEILDSLQEPLFDEIVELARIISGRPVALISLIDRDRQWFKANAGLEDVRQTDRSAAFCDRVVCGRQALEIADAMEDERFSSNPLVIGEPGIRYYFGAPLTTRQDNYLGALCVVDYQPAALSVKEQRAITQLAKIVTRLIEARKLLIDAERAQQRNLEAAEATALTGALAKLSGGIAHRFNNILGGIGLAGEFLESEVRSTDGREMLKGLQQSVESGSRLTQSFLSLSGKRSGQPSNVQIEPAIRRVVEMLKSIYPSEIESCPIDVTVSEPDVVMGIESRAFSISLLNLLENALEAQPAGGRIHVLLERRGSTRCTVAIDDAGPGISEELLDQVTLPLFTTKEPPLGHGFGLSSAKGFCHGLGGELRLLSSPMGGLRVEMILPCASPQQPESRSQDSMRKMDS